MGDDVGPALVSPCFSLEPAGGRVEVFFDSHPALHACYNFHVALAFGAGFLLDAVDLVLEVTYSPLCYFPSLYSCSLVDKFGV